MKFLRDERTRAAIVSVFSNVVLTAAKLIVGILMCSVSVIAEAVHSAIDLLASLVACFSVHEAGKPADDQHRYGHGKIEGLSGMIEALLIFGVAGYIIYTSSLKLMTGHFHVDDLSIGLVVMGCSAFVNLFVSTYLYKVARKTDSLALEADALHLRTDVYTSAGVFVGLFAIQMTGLKMLDPIIAIVVALLIVKVSWHLTVVAIQNILDTKLPDEEERVIREVLEDKSNIVEIHKLRTRKSGNTRHIDFHVVLSKSITLEESHAIGHVLEEEIKKRLPNCQVLFHAEPCAAQCEFCKVNCTKQAFA